MTSEVIYHEIIQYSILNYIIKCTVNHLTLSDISAKRQMTSEVI